MLRWGAKTVPQSWMFSRKGIALWPIVFIVHFYKNGFHDWYSLLGLNPESDVCDM